MAIVVDIREHALIKLFERDGSLTVQTRQLQVGDVILQHSETDVVLVIERKTIADLGASIVDNRFREQKARLAESISPNKVLYIIEHSQDQTRVPKSTLNSAIENLVFKHSFKVLHTDSLKDTMDTILRLYKKLVIDETSVTELPTPNFKPVSRKEKSTANVFETQLSCVHGVSPTVAKWIAGEYKCMANLVNAFESTGDLLLQDCVPKTRRIGPALSKKISLALTS